MARKKIGIAIKMGKKGANTSASLIRPALNDEIN